jgi:S1-C subfamily serine protease
VIVRDQTGRELGTGSGFVVSSDGKVVTNYHVLHISGTTQAEARFTDGASYQVQSVLATDPNKDLAVLKLQAIGKEFQVVHLGDSDHVQIGEHVLAIGSPRWRHQSGNRSYGFVHRRLAKQQVLSFGRGADDD